MRPARGAIVLAAGLLAALVAMPGQAHGDITAADRPVQVSVVVPLTAPPGTSGLLSAEALEQYTSPVGLLTRQLDAIEGRPVTIGIDPMILVSIRVLGTDAPDSALEWLDRLRRVSNETFPLGYADSDLTLQLQAGAGAPLQPQSFDFALDPTLFSAAESPTPTPTEPESTETPTPTETVEAPDPGPPPLPTTADLLEWPYTMPAMAWPGEGTVTTADLAALAANGFETTILSSTNVTQPASPSSPLSTVDDARVLVSHSEVSAAVRTAVGSVTEEAWLGAMATVSNALGTASRTGSGVVRGIVVTLGREIPSSDSRLAQTIQAIDALPSVTLTPLSIPMSSAASDAVLVDSPLPAEVVSRFTPVLQAEAAEARFATILETPEDLTAPRRLELLALASHSWQHNPTGWPAAIGEFVARSGELLGAVQVPASSTNNFFADRQSLYITVTNALPHRVTVYITVRPQSPLIRVEDSRVELTIEPESQARGAVPVQSISNGVVDVTVTLSSRNGVHIGAPSTLELNVQAGWETPITIGIAVVVILIFGVGVARTILRRRKSARE